MRLSDSGGNSIESNMSAVAKSVSIIVPTRNEAENVAMLVSHIVASAVPFHEILFVDADSTDGTRDVIRSLTGNHPIRLIDQDQAEPTAWRIGSRHRHSAYRQGHRGGNRARR